MSSRFNSFKQAIIQADKRNRLAFRTYAGIGGLVTGAVIVTSVKDALEIEEYMANAVKRDFGKYNLKTPGKLNAGALAVMESLPIAIFAGATWPYILIRALLDL